MANPFETLLGLKPKTLGGLTESANTTPQVSSLPEKNITIPTVTTPDVNQTPLPDVTTPSSFTPDVPTVIDANTVAKSIDKPTEISPTLQAQMNERERVRNLALQREAAVGVGANEKAFAPSGATPQADTSQAPTSEGTAAVINNLFPEQPGLGDTFLKLRKETGADALDAKLQNAQDELDAVNADMEAIAQDVRNELGTDAPASFIRATIADRARRLLPELRRRQRAVDSLQRRVASVNSTINQRLGFFDKDLNREIARRTAERNNLFSIIKTLGPEAFANSTPEQIAALEQRVGLQPGVLSSGIEALRNKPEDKDTQIISSGGRMLLIDKNTGDTVKDIGPVESNFKPRIVRIGNRQVFVERNNDGTFSKTDLGLAPSSASDSQSSSRLTKAAINNAQTMLDNLALRANAGGELPGWAKDLVLKDDKSGKFKAIEVSEGNLSDVINAEKNSELAQLTSPENIARKIQANLDRGFRYKEIRERFFAAGVPPEVYRKALSLIFS